MADMTTLQQLLDIAHHDQHKGITPRSAKTASSSDTKLGQQRNTRGESTKDGPSNLSPSKERGHQLGDLKAFRNSSVKTASVDFLVDSTAQRPADDDEDTQLLFRLSAGGGYNVVRQAFRRAGFEQTDGLDFNVYWGRPLKDAEFKELDEFQKVNHFPATFLLGRKDHLARACQRFKRMFGVELFDNLPRTWVLPADRSELATEVENKEKGDLFIMKPPDGCKGEGIKITSDPVAHTRSSTVAVVSRYVSDPYLIDGTKFDLRIYAVVTGFNPLRVYVHDQGLVRFCTAKYEKESSKKCKNRYRHLTNYALNKNNSNYMKNTSELDDHIGHKWSLRALKAWMEDNGVDWGTVCQEIDALIVKTLLAVEVPINTKMAMHAPSRNTCFELFGFDVMLDSKLKPWLIEVNTMPSLASDTPIDAKIKSTVVNDVLHLIQVRAYSRKDLVEAEEEQKRRRILEKAGSGMRTPAENARRRAVCLGRSSALHELSQEDADVILECESEFERQGGFRRIFPNNDRLTREVQSCFEHKRYFNCLLYEWISKKDSFTLQDYLEGRHRETCASPKSSNSRAKTGFCRGSFPQKAVRRASLPPGQAESTESSHGPVDWESTLQIGMDTRTTTTSKCQSPGPAEVSADFSFWAECLEEAAPLESAISVFQDVGRNASEEQLFGSPLQSPTSSASTVENIASPTSSMRTPNDGRHFNRPNTAAPMRRSELRAPHERNGNASPNNVATRRLSEGQMGKLPSPKVTGSTSPTFGPPTSRGGLPATYITTLVRKYDGQCGRTELPAYLPANVHLSPSLIQSRQRIHASAGAEDRAALQRESTLSRLGRKLQWKDARRRLAATHRKVVSGALQVKKPDLEWGSGDLNAAAANHAKKEQEQVMVQQNPLMSVSALSVQALMSHHPVRPVSAIPPCRPSTSVVSRSPDGNSAPKSPDPIRPAAISAALRMTNPSRVSMHRKNEMSSGIRGAKYFRSAE